MKICIVYPYVTWLSQQSREGAQKRMVRTGGAEKQVGLLAQHLVHRGNDVTFLALDYRGHETEIGGVQIRRPWERDEGIPWLRVATHRLPGLKRLAAEIDADVYYVRGAQVVSRWVIAAAHELGSPAYLGLASDRNLLAESGRFLTPFGYGPVGKVSSRAAWLLLQRPALHAADAIIVQNEEQRFLCSQMGLPNVLIPSIVGRPAPGLPDRETEFDVFWAGNVQNASRSGKGVEPLCAIVRALPRVRFAVVGALKDDSLSSAVVELRESSNVDLFGELDYGETQEVLARSRLVLNTSTVEGFSNVMLEGWALGKPSVTLSVNPSGLLADGRWPWAEPHAQGFRGALGACATGDMRALSGLIDEALGDEAGSGSVGRRCRTYVGEVHDADVVCARYEELAPSSRYTTADKLPIVKKARAPRSGAALD